MSEKIASFGLAFVCDRIACSCMLAARTARLGPSLTAARTASSMPSATFTAGRTCSPCCSTEIEADAGESQRRQAANTGLSRRLYRSRAMTAAGVVDMLLHRLPRGFDAHFLKGNHEAILLDFLEDPASLGQWLANGADATFAVLWNVDLEELIGRRGDAGGVAPRLLASLPEAHRDFFETSRTRGRLRRLLCLCMPACGPGVPLEAQDPHDLVWIRASSSSRMRTSARSWCMGTRRGRSP